MKKMVIKSASGATALTRVAITTLQQALSALELEATSPPLDTTQAAMAALRATLAEPPSAMGIPITEPVCPSCDAPGLLYECIACGSANYPPEDLTAPELRAGIALQLREIERLRAEVKALLPDAKAYRSMGGRPLAHEGETC